MSNQGGLSRQVIFNTGFTVHVYMTMFLRKNQLCMENENEMFEGFLSEELQHFINSLTYLCNNYLIQSCQIN